MEGGTAAGLLGLEPERQGRVEDTPLALLLEAPWLGSSLVSVLAFVIQFWDIQLLCTCHRGNAVDAAVTAVPVHFWKSTAMPTLLNTVPPWGHSQVPVTCPSRLHKYLFLVDSLLEWKLHPRQNPGVAVGLVCSRQLPHLSPCKDRKEAGVNLHEVRLPLLYTALQCFPSWAGKSMCSQSVVECGNKYL